LVQSLRYTARVSDPVSAVVVQPAPEALGVVDVADVLVLPAPVGDPDDVVDDVDVLLLEPAHRVPARADRRGGGVRAVSGAEGDAEVGGHGALAVQAAHRLKAGVDPVGAPAGDGGVGPAEPDGRA